MFCPRLSASLLNVSLTEAYYVSLGILLLVIRCYLRLYDCPPKSAAEEDDEMSKLPASQKKKLRQKLRKAEARAKKVIKSASYCFWKINLV